MRKKGNNIILIGMPGSGKSTAGVILAKQIGYHFTDGDILIQETEGKKVSTLISELGPDRFVRIENRINAEVKLDKTVFATGGSAIYGRDGMFNLRDQGVVVYLKTSYRALEKRLGNLHKRGVVLKRGQTLRMLYEERAPLYAKYADLTVRQDGMTTEETVAKIIKELCLY